jgi:hypothetical protein
MTMMAQLYLYRSCSSHLRKGGAVRCVLICSTQNQKQGVKYDEYWAEFVYLSLKHLPMLFECKIEAKVVEELEREITGKVHLH